MAGGIWFSLFCAVPMDPNRRRADHQSAIDMWLNSQASRAMCCLVQFDSIPLDQLPRIYLAAPWDIARRMLDCLERVDDAILHETYEWTSPFDGVARTETLPNAWRFSPDRIEELMKDHAAETAAYSGRSGTGYQEARRAGKPLGVLREVALTA